jgi:hypothetical protein
MIEFKLANIGIIIIDLISYLYDIKQFSKMQLFIFASIIKTRY